MKMFSVLILFLCNVTYADVLTFEEFKYVVGIMIPQTNGDGWNGKEYKEKYYDENKMYQLWSSITVYSKFYNIDSLWLVANAIQQSKMKHDVVGDHGMSHGIYQIHCPDNGVFDCNNKHLLYDITTNTKVFVEWSIIRKDKCMSNMTKTCVWAKKMMGEPIIFGSIRATIRIKRLLELHLNSFRLKGVGKC